MTENRFARHPVATGALVAAILVTAIDLAGTVAYQLATHSAPADETAYRIRSSFYHHDLKPMVAQTATWGPYRYRMRTNSLGFRDAARRHVSLTTTRRRIVFLGDSFTEGIGVDYESSFVGLIATELSREGIDVLDAAVSSYSPIIYRAKAAYLLDRVGLEFDTLVVYIDLSDAEDEMEYYADNSGAIRSLEDPQLEAQDRARRERERRDAATANPVWNGFGLRPLFRDHTTLIHGGIVGAENLVSSAHRISDATPHDLREMLGKRRAMWTIDPKLWAEVGEPGLSRAAANMDGLLHSCRAHHVALAVAVYPWPDQIARADRNSKQVVFWREWAERNGVGFIDHFPDFMPEDDSSEAIEAILRRDFIPGDVHWNAQGHATIAAGFLRAFRRLPSHS